MVWSSLKVNMTVATQMKMRSVDETEVGGAMVQERSLSQRPLDLVTMENSVPKFCPLLTERIVMEHSPCVAGSRKMRLRQLGNTVFKTLVS